MCMMFSQCNTCSMFIYHGHAGLHVYDIVSMGVWPYRGLYSAPRPFLLTLTTVNVDYVKDVPSIQLGLHAV